MGSATSSALTIALLIALIALVGATIYIAVSPKIGERFTEFYILGPEGKAYNYPTNLTVGQEATVIIGVVNHEYEEVSYRIEVRLDNETLDVIDGIRLAHGESWHYNYTFSINKPVERAKLEFILYREGLEGPYRTLWLWITVREG